MENTKQPTFKWFLNKRKREEFSKRTFYICTCDFDQVKYHEIGGVKLERLNKYNPDHRFNHPNIGTIVYASEGAQFKVGQRIICKHSTFENSEFKSQEFYTTKEGERLFSVDNFQVMFGINDLDNSLEPREGVLLCEGVYGKFVDTDLEVTNDLKGRRRDIAKIVKPWNGCEDFREGDFVMLRMGGDYPLEWYGKQFIKVDIQYEDAFAKVDSSEWYDSVVRKHVDHYNSATVTMG